MNNKLFNTAPKVDLAAQTVEYQIYVEVFAKNIVVKIGDRTPSADSFAAMAEEEVRWGSWVISAVRRKFAYNYSFTVMLGETPIQPGYKGQKLAVSEDDAAKMISQHIAKRAMQIYDAQKPHSYMLFFIAANRWVLWGDVDPTCDGDGVAAGQLNWHTKSKEHAEEAARSIFEAWRSVGLPVPLIEIVPLDSTGKRI